MKKRALSLILTLALLFACALLGTIPTVSAADYNNCYYRSEDGSVSINFDVTDGNATITSISIDSSVSAYSIPSSVRYVNQYDYLIGEFPVTGIGNGAFSSRSNLTSITIPGTVTHIGHGAFSHCSSLRSITIPESVTSMGPVVFDYCTSLTTVNFNAVNCSSGSMGHCPSLTTVNIGDTVQTIPWGMFSNCSSLTTVTGGSALTSIGDDAFSHCSALSSITIPDSVTEIGALAFQGCSSLTEITIPEKLTRVGDGAFVDCTSLTTVNYNAANPPMLPEDLEEDPYYDNQIFRGCRITTLNIGENVQMLSEKILRVFDLYDYYNSERITPTTLNYNAVNCTEVEFGFHLYENLTTVNIGDTVETIPDGAFDGCDLLTTITIPESVTAIGNNAFGDCPSLTTVNFNAVNCANTVWNEVLEDGRVIVYVDTIFGDSPSLTTVNIGDKVKRIPAKAFYCCPALSTVNFPGSLTEIGDEAFYDCYSLTGMLTIPQNVVSIGEEAFAYCQFTTLNFNAANCTIPTERETNFGFLDVHPFQIGALTTVNIGSTVGRIPDCLIFGHGKVTTVHIAGGVTEIGYDAFAGCWRLTTVTIPASVTTIQGGAFGRDWAGADCKALTDVYYGGTREQWEAIDVEYDNDALLNAIIHCQCGGPDSWRPADCTRPAVCSGCGATKGEPLGHAWSSVDCTEHAVCIRCGAETAGHTWIEATCTEPKFCTRCGETQGEALGHYFEDGKCIRCGALRAEISIGDCFWRLDGTVLTIYGNGAMADGESPWSGQTITEVRIEKGVTHIGVGAFMWCDELTSVTMADTVKTIGGAAFCYCYSLTSVVLSDSLTTIGDWAFCSCPNLTSVTIPDSVTTIGAFAFGECYSLTSVDIPDSVTTIGEGAFAYCDSLTDVYYTDTEAQWNSIAVGADNDALLNATIHFGGTGGDEPVEPECDHSWSDATCTAPATCTLCGETSGSALGHSYVDGICSVCGDMDGWVTKGTKTYYYENGAALKGLQKLGGNYYYFHHVTGSMFVDTTVFLSGENMDLARGNYTVGVDGKIELVKNGFITVGDKTYYYVDDVKQTGMQKIGNDYYYFHSAAGYMFVDTTVFLSGENMDLARGNYTVGVDGKIELVKNGFITVGDKTYYYVDDVKQTGVQKIGNDYYYFHNAAGYMFADTTVFLSNTYNELTRGNYYVGKDGKIVRTGWAYINGKTYYLEDGVALKGAQTLEDKYYYFSTGDGSMKKSTEDTQVILWVPANNDGGVPYGKYIAGEDGVLTLA